MRIERSLSIIARGMSHAYRDKVIHVKDFITATPNGNSISSLSKSLLVQIASDARSLHDYFVVLDTRNAESKLAAIDIWYLAAERTGALCGLRKPKDRRLILGQLAV